MMPHRKQNAQCLYEDIALSQKVSLKDARDYNLHSGCAAAVLVTENDDLRVRSPCQRVRTQRNAFVREASHRNLHKIGLLSLIEPHEQR
ncbi:hypothetical protein ACRRTK_015722 [Alexandromys fortis]